MRQLLSPLVLVLLLAAGCNCLGPQTTGSEGLPEADRAVVDFGRVRLGESRREQLVVKNLGRAGLEVRELAREGLSAAYRVSQVPRQIPASGEIAITIVFAPDAVGPSGGKLVLRTDSADAPELTIDVRGEGVETNVVVTPATVDFGVAEVDTTVAREITLSNEGAITEQLEVVALADGSPHFAGGPVPGDGRTITLAPGEKVTLPVTFTPRWAEEGGFVSLVSVLPCPTCATLSVPLKGVGVDSFLTVEPRGTKCLDFGFVNPGSSLTKVVRVGNLGALDLSVLGGTITAGAGKFTLGGSFPVAVGAHQTVDLPVTYSPTAMQVDTGRLVLTSDDVKASSVEICLKGTGGGPDVTVQPTSVAFGTVAVGSPRVRTIRVANAGNAPPAGSGIVAPPLVIERATVRSGTTRGYSVEWTPKQLAPGESLTMKLTYAPTDDGPDDDVLELATNDSDSPLVEVPLSGLGRQLPPCVLEMLPTGGTLAFGNVDRGRVATLPFAARNVGSGDCVVDAVRLSPTSHPAFSLVSPPTAERVLAPGDTLSVAVAFKPVLQGSFTGEVRFGVSDPAAPERVVPLTGVSRAGCLLISPDELDFGNTGPTCTTGERTISIYNTCGNAVNVGGIALNADPAQPFALTLPPISFPFAVTGSNSITLKVRYHPLESGHHFGGIFVQGDERPEPYLVSLSGGAEPNAVQRDHFAQDRRPIDILFVIDDSGSMGDEQTSLAQNLDSFLRYANKSHVDYRIAVTTTDTDSANGAAGRFVPLTQTGSWPAAGATPPRVLTPRTSDVVRAFATNVHVGTNGSGTERGLDAAYRALTQPLINGHNQGFLRDDAALSVIAVTDETEQSPLDLNFYYSAFLSVKGPRRANLFSFSAICEMDPNDRGNYGGRYIEMANRTGGVVSSIRTANWAADLEKLGLTAFGFKSRFFLTSSPDPASIKVLIDGVEMQAAEVDSVNWTYVADSNLVEFGAHAVPEPGTSIEISYTVRCSP